MRAAHGILLTPVTAPAASPESEHDSPVIYSERPSTYEAVGQVFRQRHESAGLLHAADAIPGGSQGRGGRPIYLRWIDITGVEMPPPHMMNFLLDAYMTSVHWFMSVFHEPSIRAEAHAVLATGLVEDSHKLVPILLLVIIAMGARYVSPDAARQACPDHDIPQLEPVWIRCVENKLLDAFEEGGAEAVQISIILKSYYLYGSRPKRSIAILGAGIKVALSMKLHLEDTWNISDPIEINVRRRLWWSLYVADVWAATIYGTPCNIHDDDWDVALPDNIDDGSATCPGYNSVDCMNGKHFGQTTVFSYQRFKFTLYKLAFSIINTVYSHRKTTLEDTINRIKRLDERLKLWEAEIPPELLLKKIAGTGAALDDTTRLFQRQALVLQISYDNFRLLLHRPLLTINRLSLSARKLPAALTSQADHSKAIDETIKASKYTCWEAAIRTSKIGQVRDTMGGMRYSLGANYTMIQAFTAGVALGIFALSDPASKQAYEAKGAISAILAFPRLFGYKAVIFDQTTNILEELLRLILNEEMRALVRRDAEPIGTSRRSHGANKLADPTTNEALSANTPTSPMNNTVLPSPNASGVNDISYGNFSDALVSLQDAFRDGRGMEMPGYASTSQINGTTYGLPTSELRNETWMSNPFGNESQGWIWDDAWQVQDITFDQFSMTTPTLSRYDRNYMDPDVDRRE